MYTHESYYIYSDVRRLIPSKKFRTGPFEQTPQDLKRAARARAKMKPKFFFWWRARARRVLGLVGSVRNFLDTVLTCFARA